MIQMIRGTGDTLASIHALTSSGATVELVRVRWPASELTPVLESVRLRDATIAEARQMESALSMAGVLADLAISEAFLTDRPKQGAHYPNPNGQDGKVYLVREEAA